MRILRIKARTRQRHGVDNTKERKQPSAEDAETQCDTHVNEENSDEDKEETENPREEDANSDL